MATLASGLIGTMILSSRATSVVATLGTDLIITTITATTSSIGSMIGYLTTNKNPGIFDVNNILISTDLDFTIGIIEQIVREQEGKPLNESIKKALIGVNNILEAIHYELDSIKKAIENHKTKYFSSWRSFSWNGTIDSLKKHSDILKHRYSILFELLKISNSLRQ